MGTSFQHTNLAYFHCSSKSHRAHLHLASHLAGPVPAKGHLSCHSESAQSVYSGVTTILRALLPKHHPTTPLKSAGLVTFTNLVNRCRDRNTENPLRKSTKRS